MSSQADDLSQWNVCGRCADSGLDFYDTTANCTLAARFLAPWFSSRVIDLDALTDYGRSFGGQNVLDVNVLVWFSCARECNNTQLNERLIFTPKKVCQKQLCRALKWDGNADIVGIGMMVVYVLGAVLTTAYLGGFLQMMLGRGQGQGSTFKEARFRFQQQPGVWNKLRNIFYHSFGAYHTGLGLLTLSVLIANLDVARRRESIYGIQTSILAATSLTAMFFLTLPIRFDVEQRTRSSVIYTLLIGLLFFVALPVSSTATITLTGTRFDGRFEDGTRMDAFEIDCGPLSWKPELPVIILVTIAGGCAMLWGVVYFILGCISESAKTSMEQLGNRTPWRLVNSVYFSVLMWTALGCLLRLQSEMAGANGQDKAAESEAKWGFGQILALATWVPVLEEMVILAFEKAQVAQQGRLNKHFIAVEATEDETNEDSQPLVPISNETKSSVQVQVQEAHPVGV